MLKGVKKGEVNKSDYRFEKKGEGYYKVVNKATTKYRIMSKDKVESIFGKIDKKEEKETKKKDDIKNPALTIEKIIENIDDIEAINGSSFSSEEKKVINKKCEELEIDVKSYKEKITLIIEKKDN